MYYISFHFISFHFISFHFISLHYIIYIHTTTPHNTNNDTNENHDNNDNNDISPLHLGGLRADGPVPGVWVPRLDFDNALPTNMRIGS